MPSVPMLLHTGLRRLPLLSILKPSARAVGRSRLPLTWGDMGIHSLHHAVLSPEVASAFRGECQRLGHGTGRRGSIRCLQMLASSSGREGSTRMSVFSSSVLAWSHLTVAVETG